MVTAANSRPISAKYRETVLVREISPRQSMSGPYDGGGGGTVIPHLSMRPGLCLHPVNSMYWMRGVLSVGINTQRILVLALQLLGEPMSLYRATLRLARLLPLGVAMLSIHPFFDNVRVRRCEPRFHSAVTRKGDQINRTRVRKPSALRSTCLFRL